MMIEGTAQYLGRDCPAEIEMRALSERVDARIGAPRTVDGDPLAAEARDRSLECFLHRGAVRLALPADQPPAVIFDRQFVAGQGSTVLAAIG